MKMRCCLTEKGMALSIVMITLILLSLIAGYAMNLNYNMNLLNNASNGKQIKIYYAAQAGVVQALWKIRTDPLMANPNYTCAYSIDIDGDGVFDTYIFIDVLDQNPASNTFGLRPISSKGMDHYGSTAAARQVKVVTYYPAPKGYFKDLDVTGNAGDVQLTNSGGPVTMGNTATGLAVGATAQNPLSVTIGSAVRTVRPFQVTGHANGRYTASFSSGMASGNVLNPVINNIGVGVGEDSNGASPNYRVIQGRGPNNTTTQLGINAVNGAVGTVGMGAASIDTINNSLLGTNCDLLIAGVTGAGLGSVNTGTLGITSGGQTGEVKVAQSGVNNQYYAVFA